MRWLNRIKEAQKQAEEIILNSRLYGNQERMELIAEGVKEYNAKHELADNELNAAKLYPLTPQEYLNGLAVDAGQLTFRACMTTLRALRERSIIPPMGATTTVLHEHAGAINALDSALNYMESERKAAMKKVNNAANKAASVKT